MVFTNTRLKSNEKMDVLASYIFSVSQHTLVFLKECIYTVKVPFFFFQVLGLLGLCFTYHKFQNYYLYYLGCNCMDIIKKTVPVLLREQMSQKYLKKLSV